MSDKDNNAPIIGDPNNKNYQSRIEEILRRREEEEKQSTTSPSPKPDTKAAKDVTRDGERATKQATPETSRVENGNINNENKTRSEAQKERKSPHLGDMFLGRPTNQTSSYQKPSPVTDESRFKELQERNTNFIFVYGASEAGKSCFLVSLLNHMTKSTEFELVPQNLENPHINHSNAIAEEMIEAFSVGIPPLPTEVADFPVYEIEYVLTPNSPPRIPAKFTFLEMSGEIFENVYVKKTSVRSLHNNIDVFLKCPGLQISFIVLVPNDAGEGDFTWAKIDGRTLSFLNYIEEYQPNFDVSNILMLVTKWDKYKGPYKDSEEFIKNNMERTYARLYNKGSIVSEYSIGKVVTVDVSEQAEGYDNIPANVRKLIPPGRKETDYILPNKINRHYPEIVKNWIYTAVTGVEPNSGTWIMRFLKKFGLTD